MFATCIRMSWTTALALLLCAVVTLAVAPSAHADDGYWRLSEGRQLQPEGDEVESLRSSQLLSYRLSWTPTVRGLITKADYFSRSEPLGIVTRYHISWEWTAIPVILRPGDKLPMTLKGAVRQQPTADRGNPGFVYPQMRVQFYRPGADRWTPIRGFTTGGLKFSSGEPKVLTGDVRVVGTVPGGGEEVGLALVVEISHHVQWDRQYVYVWDDGPLPSVIPDPISPEETDIEGAVRRAWERARGSERGRERERAPERDSDSRQERDPENDRTGRRDQDDDDPLRDQPAGMTLQADRRSVEPGGEVLVPVRLINGRNIGNLDFKVTFDPSVVRPAGTAVRGNILGDAGLQSNPADRGRVWIAFATAGRINGSGTIVQLPFEAVGQPGDRTTLGLEVTIFNDSRDVSSIVRMPGEIRILEAGREKGDLNNNDVIDAGDALEALKMAVRLIPMDLNADMDDDGTVTSNDARILLRMARSR